jgi:pyrimidine operon attenuation protein/uracil phosphoribosyltransferase
MRNFKEFLTLLSESSTIEQDSLKEQYQIEEILLENGCNICLFSSAGMEPDNRGLVNPDIRRLKGTLGAVQTLNNTKAGHIINQAAKMFSEHMVDKNFDVIGTIKTMKTNLAEDLVDKIDFSDGRKPMVLKNLIYLTKTRDDVKTTSETIDKKISRMFKFGDFDIEKIGKDDKANVKGFLGVNPSLENKIMGKNIAIIDDYAETGTTLREACDALLKCGAKSVSGYAILK